MSLPQPGHCAIVSAEAENALPQPGQLRRFWSTSWGVDLAAVSQVGHCLLAPGTAGNVFPQVGHICSFWSAWFDIADE